MENQFTLICCAMESEATPLIQKLHLELIQAKPFPLYQKDHLLLGIAGIGSVLLGSMITWVYSHYPVSKLINYGLAGGYSDIHKGSILLVSECLPTNSFIKDKTINYGVFHEDGDVTLRYYQGSKELLDSFKECYPNCIEGKLGSGDVWHKDIQEINEFYKQYQLLGEDMECASVYELGEYYSIPCISIKGISNNEVLKETYDYSVMDTLISAVLTYLKKDSRK